MTQFWINDFKQLFNKNNFYKIIPTESMNSNEKFNSLTRLLIYLLIVILIIPSTRKLWYVPIILILLIVIYYFLTNKTENFELIEESTENSINEEKIDETELFAKWVYSTPETCKENPAKCVPYHDIRYHSPSMYM
jgi:hypothetical protein